MSIHKQVLTSNGHVDEGMVDLLEAVWRSGIATQFSCQGGSHYPGSPDMTQNGNIVFASVNDGLRFMRVTMQKSWWYNRLRMTLMEPVESVLLGLDGEPRCIVEWQAIDEATGLNVTQALTDVWCGRKPYDAYSFRRDV